MVRWFLSYNSQDLALMQGLYAALRRKDPKAPIYFAPTILRAGGFWLPELAKGIAEATAFVLLVGEKGVGPWQVIEYYEALDRRVKQHDFPIVVVLLDGVPAPGLPFLRQLQWIINANPASEQSVAQIMDAAMGVGAPPGELWRHTAPYRGLAAMEEKDSDYFFGREDKTVEVIRALEATPDKLPILLGNSGVGKSSLAQAGVLATLLRQGWPETSKNAEGWPQAFSASRTWCVLTLKPGTEPVRALVEPFIRAWQFDPTDPRREMRLNEWTTSLIEGGGSLRGLLDATTVRLDELGGARPPAFLLYVDQGEELYVRAEERHRQRFSQILAEGLVDERLRALMSLRADFFGDLQKDEPLYAVHRLVSVPPLREAQLHEVVSKPATLLGAHFETDHLAADIARRAAEESTKDAGALPLLSYLLDDMWKSRDPKWDGVLRLPSPAIELGRVLVDRADAFLRTHSNAEEMLRRIFTLKLSTVRQDGEPTRRRAARSEFSDEEWRLVSELADHPNRLLVTVTPEAGADAKPTPAVGETYAEVAHEAIFRRWDKLRGWIAAEREFLTWRTSLEAARRTWETASPESRNDALPSGLLLAQAQTFLAQRPGDFLSVDRSFIVQSMERDRRAKRRVRRFQASIYVLLVGVIIGLIGWMKEAWIVEQWRWFTAIRPYMLTQVRPHVLAAEAERALKPGDSFKECAEDCPQMVVVPAGEFIMGSPASERGRVKTEQPQHKVVLARPFAVAKFAVTFDDWDACVAYGNCDPRVNTSFGRGRQPVVNVSWDDARDYAAWLSRMTGKPYRLLSEAEFEYAARAGTRTAYPWGDAIGRNNANCEGCGSRWDGAQPAPVGSFAANRFGLYDMHGNVWQWTEDCDHGNYQGAPEDGSAWIEGSDCQRVIRGGSWESAPRLLRSALRYAAARDIRNGRLGFRVARTLSAGAGAP
ncbi:MAG: SUMF1/EgtB/PvdO family nonheme iron enzyme [Hyphomicrobiales bacterium]|nr:SUMF1/EgtB/PvdO family nonheme iron enzyme [Hyphomicrobiales bacterium]MBV8825242.1 SUMF1/EgtB/PvdO family nonheme iron enzyme [Hyphomicrobiales bacterium]MBV9427368.1 SUMF1/EgtB/PvdO family nonheme iron enzyme [Bradyrhizobiaceae bacterium]